MTAQDVRCPDWLATQLLAHRDQHGPHYQGFLSDHLPMAMLAMHALGAPRFDPQAAPAPTRIDDEHDAKMAFSCLEQACRLRSRGFDEAATVYTPQFAPHTVRYRGRVEEAL